MALLISHFEFSEVMCRGASAHRSGSNRKGDLGTLRKSLSSSIQFCWEDLLGLAIK